MATGRKTGGRDFKPGQSGNPAGKKAEEPELRAAKKIMKTEFEATMLELLALPYAQLKKLASEADAVQAGTVSLKMALARGLHKSIALGDLSRLTFYLDRLVGPVAKQLELSGRDGEPLQPLVAMSSQELTVTLVAIQKLMKEKEWNFPQSLPHSSESPPVSGQRGSRGAR